MFMASVASPVSSNITSMILYLRSKEKLPCINSVTVVEKEPVEESALASWEQRNNCILPSDIRNFYSATDGLQVKWSWKIKGDPVPGGVSEIVSLGKLRRVTPKRHSIHSDLPTLLDIESDQEDYAQNSEIFQKPSFKDKSKVFMLDNCQGTGKVCLVFLKKKDASSDGSTFPPSIWFLDRALEWHYLAPDFTSYFRLALAHLGIPQWQYHFTLAGPPSRTKQLLYMFAPERITQILS